MMELIDEAHANAADAGAGLIVECGSFLACDEHFAGCRFFEEAGDVKQR